MHTDGALPHITQFAGTQVPVKHWLPLEDIESGAIAQLENAASHPRVIEHLAVMPDVHQGYGIPVGSVMVTREAVIPNAVGVDIGCGIAAVNTGVVESEEHDEAFWRAWAHEVNRSIPTGFTSHKDEQAWAGFTTPPFAPVFDTERDKSRRQLGTLGGGNHFLEAGVDEEGHIWLLVHSGSRGIGKRMADHYHAKALKIRESMSVDVHPDLAYLSINTDNGIHYLSDMMWAATYAKESRLRMIRQMERAFGRVGNMVIDTSHNLAYVDGDRVIHRKGATDATAGTASVIPGSMGTRSFIVEGRGNPESHQSCSHGAGRRMSRGQAKRTFGLDDISAQLLGTHTAPSLSLADEAPDAYKDIERVIALQHDLLYPVWRLSPRITVKGDARAGD